MKGSGMPVNGIVAVMPPRLIRAWTTNQEVMPAARRKPKGSGAWAAMR